MPPRYSREIEQPIVMGDSLKDQFRTSPCEASCPAGNPIQKMQSLVEKGRFGEALRYLRARNPFPCLARGLRRALPSDVEGCGGISEAPTFLVLLSHKSTNRSSMRCILNKHRTLRLLSVCPSFLLSVPPHKKEPAGPFSF